MIEVHIGEAASYAASGVDIHAGDEISGLWHAASAETYRNRNDRLGQLAVTANLFSGVRGFDLDVIQGKAGLVLSAGVDGVGTKTELAERSQVLRNSVDSLELRQKIRSHRGIFEDVIAMTADDLARDGGEPFALCTLFDVNSLKAGGDSEQARQAVWQLTQGLISGARQANVVVINGETAELGNRVGGFGVFNYNLGGFALGASHRSRILDGTKVQPGDKVVAVKEEGFRSNGMSLVRKVLAAEYDEDWHMQDREQDEPLVSQALRPSTIYTPAFVDLHGGYDIDREPKAELSAIVHVTGGGIPGKLQRILGVTGNGAVIEDAYEPPSIMQTIQRMSMKHGHPDPAKDLRTPDASSYQSLNMGNGALIITSDEENVLRTLAEHGREAKIAGEIVEEPGISLKSKGVTNPGEWIHFIPQAA